MRSSVWYKKKKGEWGFEAMQRLHCLSMYNYATGSEEILRSDMDLGEKHLVQRWYGWGMCPGREERLKQMRVLAMRTPGR